MGKRKRSRDRELPSVGVVECGKQHHPQEWGTAHWHTDPRSRGYLATSEMEERQEEAFCTIRCAKSFLSRR